MEFDFKIKKANGSPGPLTQDDVWGKISDDFSKRLSHGMIVARGLPTIDKYFSEEDHKRATTNHYPDVCPVWKDKLPYKSVTAICNEAQVGEVSYWLEYVQGGGSVQAIQDLPDGKVAIRSDYMCW